MIEKVCHIGPALNVQGGISSVLVSYKKLFHLPDENFLASYNGSFKKSLPQFILLCLKLLFCPPKFDFFQIHTSSYGSFFRKYLLSLCLRIRGKKYTAHIHGSVFDQFCKNSNAIIQWCIKDYLKHAKKIIAITPHMEKFLEDFFCLKNFVVIPNPCENVAEIPTDLSLHQEPVKIIFSGRFGDRKGVFDLLKAYEKANFNFKTELHLFGDGDVEGVKNAAQQNQKKELIRVSGWLEHSQYVANLSQYDLLVLPSYAETFGMSLVEAMGQGIPVISTFSGGVPYVVENGICGILIEAGDIAALSKSLETLVNDKSLRIQMGNAAWKRTKNFFTKEVVKQKLEVLYSNLEQG